ncbi:hypothetical protein KCP76_24680 [Salmonella enterica subsp. enterica serovar Weltevreden]|nr:hypothetical protein KCP76_24680 [Salmonella enterica subsp. enterica serovar Weltevreden]
MAVLPRTEAVTERCTLIRHYHCCGYRSDCIRGLSLREGSASARSTPAYNAWRSRKSGPAHPRLTLLAQIRIKGSYAALSRQIRQGTIWSQLLAYCAQRPPVTSARRFAVPCHNGDVSAAHPETPRRIIAVCEAEHDCRPQMPL